MSANLRMCHIRCKWIDAYVPLRKSTRRPELKDEKRAYMYLFLLGADGYRLMSAMEKLANTSTSTCI